MTLVDNVIALHQGEIVMMGTPGNVLNNDRYESATGSVFWSSSGADEPQENEVPITKTVQGTPLHDGDQRRKKSELTTYTYYFSNSGWHLLLGNIVSVTIWMFLTEFSSKIIPFMSLLCARFADVIAAVWLKWWSEENERRPNHRIGMYMGLYATFGGIGTLCACMGGW